MLASTGQVTQQNGQMKRGIMSRPKTDEHWRVRITQLMAQNLSGLAIGRVLAEEAQAADRDDCPSDRTIRRIIEEQKKELGPEGLRLAGLFYWPESMLSGDLPWEAGRAALDLVRYREHGGGGGGRPLIGEALWFW